MKIKIKEYQQKLSKEELQEHLKLKRGVGGHKSKKDYTRKPKYKSSI